MPAIGQIIPKYTHPHSETYINDNTIFEEIVSEPESGVRFINVFTSSKGRDGVVLKKTKHTDFIEEYGNPNYKLFAQPGYMPYAALKTFQAECHCMRVMPDDASYSNAIIIAKIKVDTTVVGSPKLLIRHQSVFLTNFTDKTEFSVNVELLKDTDPDEDGWLTFPLFGAYVLGRGIYGDTTRLRLSASPQADLENGYKNYRFEVLDSEGGLTRKELFTGSLYTDAIISSNTLYIEELINDSDGSTKIGFYVSENSLNEILTIYNEQVADEDAQLTLQTFDIITARSMIATTLTDIVISNTASDVSLDRVEGILFSGGNDGSFSVSGDAGVRETAIDTAYIKAFTEDKVLLSKRRTPADLILDAGYSDDVKRALISFITNRYDAYGFIDGGILETPSDAITWAESMTSLADRVFSKECNHYYIKDPFSGKSIPMTITYFYAGQLPLHFKTNGNNTPFQGETYAKLTGFVKNSLKPIIDADDNDIKETLYNLRVNYFECIAENTFIRGVQGTSQNVWSDLSEEHNMHVLLELKRKVEALVASKSYNFAEKEDRIEFTETAERIFGPYRGKKVREISVYFDMSPFEEERSILHCYMEIIYKTIAKRGIIEIDINKRV